MRTLELQVGFVQVEHDLGVDQSNWRLGLCHRGVRRPARRRWSARWDGVGPGAQRYLEDLFLEAGQGADVISWTPPDEIAPIAVRMLGLEVSESSAADRVMTATLEEVLEPCSSV